MSTLPSVERLHEVLAYDPATGVLTRRAHPGMKPQQITRFAGKPAGYASPRGYVQVAVDGKLYFAHRLIWKMVYGVEPGEIDHRDCDGGNNRLDNLREGTRSQNVMNRRGKERLLPKGVKQTPAGTFVAEVRANGRRFRLGTFQSAEAAHRAYRAAVITHHGEFARPS